VNIKRFILFLGLLTSLGYLNAQDVRPKMRRACLNRSDSTLDLLWVKPINGCGSINNFSIYGRDDILGLFVYLGNRTDISLDNINFKLKNLRSWELYLVYNSDCNGIDSIFSDTITIDNTAPDNSQIDSVSIDLATQKAIIGWSRNASIDTKGYLIYHVTGSNDVISSTEQTQYLDNGARNPSSASVSYSIAAYDSCQNTSLISETHSTIFLSSQYNQCNKTISLSWTNYVGWQVSEYQIYRSINSGNFELVGTVISNINQFTYNFSSFGDSYCFFIRAIKIDGTSSSSSINTCINTPLIIGSKNSYVAKASVQNNHIEITLVTETGTSLQNILLYKSENNGAFQLNQTINTSGGIINLIDNNVRVNRFTYSYYFTTQGPCDFIFDTSQVATSVLLRVNQVEAETQELNWNLYNAFIKGTQNQEILLGNSIDFNKSSPWNIIQQTNNNISTFTDNSMFSENFQRLCYCIKSIENNPNVTFNRQDTSYSNVVCVDAEPIVYFPNAIQINGFNTVFKPKGLFLNNTESFIYIYNRWGELLHTVNDLNTGWDGKDQKGDFVQSDIYVYKATIVGINGKKLNFSGTISVLK
jgi:gliding motility-associated-like protein